MKEDEVFFLRKSASGKGVFAFPPAKEDEKPKWLLIGSLEAVRDVIDGKKPAAALTIKKVREEIEE